MALLTGNVIGSPQDQGIVGIPPGFVLKEFLGTAAISNAPAKVWPLFDGMDRKPALAASVSRPIWLVRTALTIPEVCLGTAGDQLKVATTVTDSASYIASSLAVDSGGFLQPQGATPTNAPYNFTQITSSVEFQLFLHASNAAPTGNLTVAITSPDPLVTPPPVPTKVTRILCQILWLERQPAPSKSDDYNVSNIQNRIDLGIPLY